MAKQLVFTCPDCLSHRLECCESGPYASEVTKINEDGDFDYGPIHADGKIKRFQCLDCAYVFRAKSTVEAAEWIKKNCPQFE